MKRDTLESLMEFAKNELAEIEYNEVEQQMNATLDVNELARRGFTNSVAALTRDGQATVKWEDLKPAQRADFVAIARGVLDGVIAAGAIVLKDSADERFGVTVIG